MHDKQVNQEEVAPGYYINRLSLLGLGMLGVFSSECLVGMYLSGIDWDALDFLLFSTIYIVCMIGIVRWVMSKWIYAREDKSARISLLSIILYMQILITLLHLMFLFPYLVFPIKTSLANVGKGLGLSFTYCLLLCICIYAAKRAVKKAFPNETGPEFTIYDKHNRPGSAKPVFWAWSNKSGDEKK